VPAGGACHAIAVGSGESSRSSPYKRTSSGESAPKPAGKESTRRTPAPRRASHRLRKARSRTPLRHHARRHVDGFCVEINGVSSGRDARARRVVERRDDEAFAPPLIGADHAGTARQKSSPAHGRRGERAQNAATRAAGTRRAAPPSSRRGSRGLGKTRRTCGRCPQAAPCARARARRSPPTRLPSAHDGLAPRARLVEPREIHPDRTGLRCRRRSTRVPSSCANARMKSGMPSATSLPQLTMTRSRVPYACARACAHHADAAALADHRTDGA